MKKSIFILMAVVLGITACNDKDELVSNANQRDAVHYSTLPMVAAVQGGHSKSRNCIAGGGNCMIAITDQTYTGDDGTRPVELTLLDPGNLAISNLNGNVNEDGDFLEFDDLTDLPTSIAAALGFGSISILAGQYETKFDVNPDGITIVSITSN